MNGTLEAVDGRPALRFERRLDHSVERVWRAITAPAELARWFLAPVEWKPEAGEVFEAEGQTGEITELEPPHLIAYAWGGELFRFELRPDGDGCLLVFEHVFDDRALGAQHAAGWEVYLNRLDSHLGGTSCPWTTPTRSSQSCTSATPSASASTRRSAGAPSPRSRRGR